VVSVVVSAVIGALLVSIVAVYIGANANTLCGIPGGPC
jgi:hypothetical protein